MCTCYTMFGHKEGRGKWKERIFPFKCLACKEKEKENNLTVDINPKLFSLVSPKLGGHEMVE